MWPKLIDFISQSNTEKANFESSRISLLKLYEQVRQLQKKIKRFQRLATVRKKDVSKEINNSNLVQNEITKNESLIDQINTIMESSKNNSSTKIINSGIFKNNAQLLTTLQSQKNIASNRNKYLRSEKEIIRKKIIENNFKKIKAEEKAKEYKRLYISELENKNYQ